MRRAMLAMALFAGVVACTSFGTALDMGSDAGADVASGPDASAAPATCKGTFCDDFELGNFSLWTSKRSDLATLDIVATPRPDASAGNHVLRVQTNGADAGVRIDGFLSKEFVPIYPGTVAVRAFLHFKNPIAYGSVPSSFAYTLSGVANYEFLAQTFLGADWGVQTLSSDGYLYQPATESVPLGRWVCVELVVRLSKPGHVELFVDGTRYVDTDRVTIEDAPDAAASQYRVAVGFVNDGQGVTEQEVLIDDVVVLLSPDTTSSKKPRIGCD
jgi:hypothetical protein